MQLVWLARSWLTLMSINPIDLALGVKTFADASVTLSVVTVRNPALLYDLAGTGGLLYAQNYLR
jgi:hypothetical protein